MKMYLLPVLMISTFLCLNSLSQAGETTEEKIETKYNEAKKDTKKSIRKGKKKLRDVSGNGSVTKDIEDQVKNTGDELEYQGKKVKNKLD